MKKHKSVSESKPTVEHAHRKRPKSRKLRRKSKKTFGYKIGLTALIVFAMLISIIGIGYVYIYNILGEIEKETIPKDDTQLGIGDKDFSYDEGEVEIPQSKDEIIGLPYYYENVKGVTNIALFGIDAEDGNAGRSDAIIILTIDKNSDKIKLSSIVRDTYVSIQDRGMDKVNHAYAFGGPSLAIRTLNTNFHLDIRDYVSVNFTSMPQIIDKLGGIEITLTDAEASKVPGISSGGKHLLTGSQALAFSRIRSIDSDIERSRRQRDVIEAGITKLFMQPTSSYPSIAKEIFPLLKTSMSVNDMLGIGTGILTNNIRTVEQRRFPDSSLASGQYINRIYYYVFDRPATIHQMGKYIYLDE